LLDLLFDTENKGVFVRNVGLFRTTRRYTQKTALGIVTAVRTSNPIKKINVTETVSKI
jgi:hypothetical protein